MTQDLSEFIDENVRGIKPPYSYSEVEEILQKYRLAVLEEVERVVKKRKEQEREARPADEIEEIDERAYCAACDDISTIIGQLKVK